jgi:4-aminobutyrate aminotransferase
MGGVAVAPFPTAHRYGWDEATATEFALRELDYLLTTVTAPAETAAFIVEPVLGEGGYVPANSAFMAGLRERADKHGILLIVDEVQTGWGRTGRFWGHDHFGVTPDILITAKGLASGFPLSGIAASKELMAKAWPGSQGGTYGGNAVACAAALATLDVITEEKLVDNAREVGAVLEAGLNKVAADTPAISDVRGLGLMLASEFRTADGEPDAATALRAQQEAASRGLLLLTCGPFGNVVRMIPALVVTEEQVEDALQIWAGAVQTAVAG